MKMKKYINSETFEIENNIFEVDELMADSIILLNKKGYITEYCCQGHYSNFIHKVKCNNNDIKKIIKVNKIKDYDLVQKANESILYFSDIDTRIYINFKYAYLFDNLPNGFNRTKKWDDNRKEWFIDESKSVKGIEKYISFYNGNQKKTSDEIEEEIKKSNMDIYNWVKELPIKKKKKVVQLGCLNIFK